MSITEVVAMTAEAKDAARRLFMVNENLGKYVNTAKALKLDLKNLKSLKRTVDVAQEDLSKLKDLKRTVDQTKKVADATKKASDNFKKVQDLLLKKIPGSDQFDKASRIGGILGIFSAIGVVALTKLQEFIGDRTFDNLDAISIDLTKANQIAVQNGLKLKTIEAKVNKFDKELDANAKDYATLNKSVEKVGQDLTAAKKQANDALYETRKGREIVEKKINDNLYEFRKTKERIESQYSQLKKDFDKYIGNLNTGFQSKIEATVANLQRALDIANQDIRRANTEISLQQKTIDAASRITKALPASLNTAFRTVQDTTKKVLESNIIPIQQSAKRWGVTITPATVTPATVTVSESGGVTVTPSTGGVAQVTYADFSSSDIAREINAESKKQDGQISALAGGLNAVANGVVNAQNTANTALSEARRKDIYNDPSVAGLKADISKIKIDIESTKGDLGKLDTKLKEQEKVNVAALPKLDQILDKLPLIPALTASAIKPSIPTLPQIETATGTAMCNNLKTGCGKKAIDDAVGNVTGHANNNTANILGAVNAVGQVGDLALLGVINNKLGDQLPGGIGGKLSRFADWMHLDRVLNILIFGATIHNGLMLSNDIGQTFIGIINNVLQLIGLKKENGEAFDIGSVISSSIENLIKGTIGTENYQNLTTAWAKANRIYQASTNILNSFQSLTSTVLSGLELVAGQTGKIGNALRASGEVLESAYQWMNPQPKINRVTNFLERLQNGASTIQQVTQVPLDTINAITELQTANTEFIKAIKEDDKPENKGADIEQPAKLAADKQTAKIASKGLELLDIDLEADD